MRFKKSKQNLTYYNAYEEKIYSFNDDVPIRTVRNSEGARNNYDFNGQSEIVTGYTEESLFGLADVKVPETQVVDITEENGYYTTWEVEKYYAEAKEILTEAGRIQNEQVNEYNEYQKWLASQQQTP